MDYKALERATNRLLAMPKEQLRAEIEACRDGDIAQLLLNGDFFPQNDDLYIQDSYIDVSLPEALIVNHVGENISVKVVCQDRQPCSNDYNFHKYDYEVAA